MSTHGNPKGPDGPDGPDSDERQVHSRPAPFPNTSQTTVVDGAGLGAPAVQHGQSSEKDHVGTEKRSRASSTDGSVYDDRDLADGDRAEMDRRHSIVQDLARAYTRQSMVDVGADASRVIGSTDPNSPLNPHGEKFNARVWAKTVANIVNRAGNGFRKAGVCFRNVDVFGYGAPTDYQKDVGNIWLSMPNLVRGLFSKAGGGKRQIDILRGLDGIVRSGEMCVVLGPPGSGCSTLLKTMAGETNGIHVTEKSSFNYQGMTAHEMHTHHRGDAIYTAEVDVHFPQLTVGDTLTFASRARCPSQMPAAITRDQYCDHLRDVTMAMYGISHTVNTRVGDNYVRGVSGGERKRVTIAEATLSGSPLQCWDNSTRGLDSAYAVEFCKTLRLQSELFSQACVVSIYQAPQKAYDLFDKALVLYEGRQIYFGPADGAKDYFIKLGFDCPPRQTTPDFLTSMTAPTERVPRPGFNPPRTPDEFAACWRKSQEYKDLQAEMDEYEKEYAIGGHHATTFRQHKKESQAKSQRLKSPYMLSLAQQVKLCLWRGLQRLKADPSLTIGLLIVNTCLAVIVSSMFYNLQMTTASFYSRGSLLFFAVLSNALSCALEILMLYAQRPIVEKQARYAFYHPSAEAFSSVLVDLPYKFLNTILYNTVLYFMTNLNREAGPFFFFLLVSILMVLAMSGIFRSIAALSRTLSQAVVPAAVLILALVIFSGFAIPVDYMLGWCRWINWVDPVAYAFEALVINEFHNRNYTCGAYVPSPSVRGYENVSMDNAACAVVGSVPGQINVSGDNYIRLAFGFVSSHKWRNVGILIAFIFFTHIVHFTATEFISAKKSKGEVLVFRRGHAPRTATRQGRDVEQVEMGRIPVVELAGDGYASNGQAAIQASTSVFHWKDVCYDIKIKGEPRRILDHVDGWVKPGTLTALMGVSGAGKTTLLDVLAGRVSMGVITGDMLVDGKPRDKGFQRKTGYVQQQDLHLETTTVREALEFSALLRQPATTGRAEKLAYVDEVIKLLDMEEYADAVVGVLGEGLNVEQRKRLSIGVELAAKPPLLLFVDEPTSGLDSQTSWAILDLLEKLSKAGQSILCTIHQPSAMLFQRFDRLLFLAKGGRTVYFGDIGENSDVLTAYFERNGARPCPKGSNPAEWMLEAVGAAPGAETEVDWHQAWRSSPEYQAVLAELDHLQNDGSPRSSNLPQPHDDSALEEFANPLGEQLRTVAKRVFQQYWRTPSYIYAKFALCSLVGLFIGMVFLNSPLSMQGLQNQMLAAFNVLTIFGQLAQQQMPHFVTQRSLYEVRERPAKTYSWKVFMISQIMAEIPWNTLFSVFMFITIYYPVGMYKNADQAGQGSERGLLMCLLFWQFLLFTCTFSHASIAVTDTAEAGGNLAQAAFMICLLFCGVLVSREALPGFWTFMYRISPFTYWISAVLSAGLANAPVTCSTSELVNFAPPGNTTCGAYMASYIAEAGGYLTDSLATDTCSFCRMTSTNDYLAMFDMYYSTRWRDFGIGWAYVVFNIVAALGLYWLARMPKGKKKA